MFARVVGATLALASAALFCTGTARAAVPAVQVQDAARTESLPKGVSTSPDGRRLYVSNYGALNHKNISVYDAVTLKPLHHIDVPGIVVETAISPDGKTLYASNFKRNSVQFIDIESRRVTREVRAGMHPKILVVSHDGRKLFAANWGNASVSEIDTATGKRLRKLRTQLNPRGMAITRGGRLYVANFNSESIDVFEGPAMETHRRIKNVCQVPRHLALSPDESRLYITCLYHSELAVMDTKTFEIVRRVKVGKGPKAVDVTRDGRYLATADYRGSSVTIVDTADWSTRVLEVPGMIAASGIVAARAVHAPPPPPPSHDEDATVADASKSKKDAPKARAEARPDPALRFFVTGWYDNHVYSVGLAGSGHAYAVDKETEDTAKRRRLWFRAHPVE